MTLSPIPGLPRLARHDAATKAISARTNARCCPPRPNACLARLADPEWNVDEAIQPALVALCARYLTTTHDGRVLDPVANFHLANGAMIQRINWLADPSPLGRERSASLMANYVYEPDRIAARADAFVARGEVADVERGAGAPRKVGPSFPRPWRS